MGQITVEKNVGGIEGLCVITPAVHGDARGYFMETYNENDMKEAGIDIKFVQDNQSMSTKGVLRGLHFQKQYPQTKLVRAIKGSVFDVAVDLRAGSETYGKWEGVILTEENKKMFMIPKGFAHGFLVLSDESSATITIYALCSFTAFSVENSPLATFPAFCARPIIDNALLLSKIIHLLF